MTAGTTRPLEEEPAPAEDVAVVLAELGRLPLDQPLGQYLQRVADLAATVLRGVEALSVTLVEDGRARSAAFTGSVAAALDERQYDAGFGPCLDAAVSGEVVLLDLDDLGDLYPDFAREARRQGVVAAASLGLPVAQRVVGALNLYSTSGALEPTTVELAQTFGSYAAVALANASLYGSTARLAAQMQEAMSSRAVIEQAKGVLMARLAVDADEAFAHLSRTSQRTNTKLRETAADLVDRARRGEAG
ncbi:GAF and ANTAR domain-containing protein [Pseudokineococcus sp. 5B2Z-1]|uniref:GAF and ANTAR domain-containing protein n=1 Tax=Pseudokineococcus sp. 5B2Z-1 TaxID=3132744 RepID=UPI0030B19321